mmetsp:Transcript_285/g.368  ORF Transcript_285/g.368 Transcript_285/m.368 type:complete len:317 (+) Transcript_285:56-1006(+)
MYTPMATSEQMEEQYPPFATAAPHSNAALVEDVTNEEEGDIFGAPLDASSAALRLSGDFGTAGNGGSSNSLLERIQAQQMNARGMNARGMNAQGMNAHMAQPQQSVNSNTVTFEQPQQQMQMQTQTQPMMEMEQPTPQPNATAPVTEDYCYASAPNPPQYNPNTPSYSYTPHNQNSNMWSSISNTASKYATALMKSSNSILMGTAPTQSEGLLGVTPPPGGQYAPVPLHASSSSQPQPLHPPSQARISINNAGGDATTYTLPTHTSNPEESYSMKAYMIMFGTDVHNWFMESHVYVKGLVVCIAIWIVWGITGIFS